MRLTDNSGFCEIALAGCKKLTPIRLYDGFCYNDNSDPLYELSCNLFYYYYPMDAEKDMVQCEFTMTIYDRKSVTCEMNNIIGVFRKYVDSGDKDLLDELSGACYDYVEHHRALKTEDIQHIHNLTFTDCKKKITVRL